MGCFTGKIYDVSDFKKGIDECCVVIPTKYENNFSKLQNLRNNINKKCKGCINCPESKKKDKKKRRKGLIF